MTTTILTDERLIEMAANELQGHFDRLPNNIFLFARAIEQAVLQSDQVQAWKRDAERYRCLRDIAEPSDWEYIGHQSPEVIDVEIDELLREQS